MALVSSRRASQVIDSPGAEIPPLFWPSVAQWSGDVNGQPHISARIYISRITRQNTRSWTETIFLRSVYPEVACAQLSNGLSVRISSRTPLPKVRYILGRSIWGCKDRPLETRPKRTSARSFTVIQPRSAFQARSVACGGLRNVNEKNLTTLKGRQNSPLETDSRRLVICIRSRGRAVGSAPGPSSRLYTDHGIS